MRDKVFIVRAQNTEGREIAPRAVSTYEKAALEVLKIAEAHAEKVEWEALYKPKTATLSFSIEEIIFIA